MIVMLMLLLQVQVGDVEMRRCTQTELQMSEIVFLPVSIFFREMAPNSVL